MIPIMKITKNVFLNLLVLLVVSLVSSSHPIWAAPAAPEPFLIQQPDGTTIEVYNKGDERLHWIETNKGRTIARDKKSRKWFYVDHFQGTSPVLSRVPADKNYPRLLKKHIRPEKGHWSEGLDESPFSTPSAAPSAIVTESAVVSESLQSAPAAALQTTSGNIVLILVEFDDRAGTYTSQAEWTPFINEKIADYFHTASYGNVNLDPAQESSGEVDNGVVGWLHLSRTHPGSDGETISAEKQPLALDAIVAADPYINYAAYDSNADGYVDADELAIVIGVAGYEDAVGGGVLDPGVWAHKWSLPTPPTLDGVIVGAYNTGKGGYAMFGEIHTDHQATMGVMAHELAHLIFGFPDLYDTDYSSSGLGRFCLMSGGVWGKSSDEIWSGATPVLPSAWIKQRAGWVIPPKFYGIQAITAAGDATATFDNTVYRLNTDSSSEYFLVENRQALGYDRGFERWFGAGWGGLAIFHIDDTQTSNTNDTQRWVDLEEADDVQMGTDYGSPAKLWFAGQSVNLEGFSILSEPNSRCYDGTDSSVSVKDISASAPVMTATLMGTPFYFQLLYEDFDGDTPHLGWSVVDNEGAGRVWQYGQFPGTYYYTNKTGGAGHSANADSYYYYLSQDPTYPHTAAMDTELISPPFNPLDYANTYLNFKSYWSQYSSDKIAVDILCDGGSWATIWNQDDATSAVKEAPVLDITAYTTGKASCQIRFHYYDAVAYLWQVDDIEVMGTLLPTAYAGNDYPLPASQWRIMSLPRDPGGAANTVADVFSDDFPEASYGMSWILYERNRTTDSYDTLAEDAPLNLGQGYWIYSYDAATLDIAGNPTVPSYTPDCPAGCFEIPLLKATPEAGSYRFNLLGHPFAHDVAWADVRLKVASGGSSALYSPSEADSAGYLSKVLYKYDSGWVPLDDVTPGMQGSLVEFDGFLVEVLGGGIVDTYDSLSLLIPVAQPAVAAAPEVLMSAQAEAHQSPAPVATFDLWKRNVPNSHSVKPDADGWFVRLIATDDANNLQDKGNVLGQLPDSDAGYDIHDLPEFSPMGGDYLTIVFPHADWGEHAGDYASDFHAYSQKNRQDSWQFEVRTNDSHREVTLSWAGLQEVLQPSVLIDNETGEVIRMRFVEEYTFFMNGTTRSFTWKYQGRRR